ncbi:hypothetical protein [Halothece sp. PCC 7418]|uniref:hypothetical protein n=1 Tax=Halothece sp. (strain PCC 7418) TaxID=65093 RepID=UPI0002DBC5D6|nr:hypothetical protein [Halothece sp. PCC 7418]
MKIAFILKVFLFSTIVSVLIKLLAPYVEVQPLAWLALIIVFTPIVSLGILLWQRFLQFES